MRRTAVAALLAVLAAGACKVSVNDEGKLPDVDVKDNGNGGTSVNIQPGTMPDVDVTADSVAVPKVNLPEVDVPEVNVPRVDVDVNDGPRRDTARRE
jgi:hypothetical protein